MECRSLMQNWISDNMH